MASVVGAQVLASEDSLATALAIGGLAGTVAAGLLLLGLPVALIAERAIGMSSAVVLLSAHALLGGAAGSLYAVVESVAIGSDGLGPVLGIGGALLAVVARVGGSAALAGLRVVARAGGAEPR
ncbi:hypothetical protein [Motilibacter deserti]|uniref:MFS transporter n=1 Tax=Motilibacter deserti TaxID=2714956 RepID=A0ABX0H0T8_9ACTN|nr:hypothetical protein [Motilibacter deserti]NHC15449.1 hypothetical protein [Motilibacter deserti]